MLENIILGFLMSYNMSGYELKQWMTRSTSYFFDASFGSIYPALNRLETKGFISYHEVVEGSKFKKVYQINESGKTAFLKWLDEPIIFAKSKQDHLVKIFFYEMLPKEKATKHIKALIKEVEPVLKDLKGQTEEVNKNFDVSQYYYRYSTMIYGIEYYQFVINWCKNLIGNMERK
jgi:Predicted transcriptional regulators